MDIQIIENRLGIVEKTLGDLRRDRSRIFGDSFELSTPEGSATYKAEFGRAKGKLTKLSAHLNSLVGFVQIMADKVNKLIPNRGKDHGNLFRANASMLVDYSGYSSILAKIFYDYNYRERIHRTAAQRHLALIRRTLTDISDFMRQMMIDMKAGNYISSDNSILPGCDLSNILPMFTAICLTIDEAVQITYSLALETSLTKLPITLFNVYSTLMVLPYVASIYYHITCHDVRVGSITEDIFAEVNLLSTLSFPTAWKRLLNIHFFN